MRTSWVGVMLLACLTACGEGNPVDSGSDPAPTTDLRTSDLVGSTPEGLAAGLLEHLSGQQVNFVGGNRSANAIDVMVRTATRGLDSVNLHVYLGPDDDRPVPCGTDVGYSSVSCEADDATSRELLVRTNGDREMPALMGRVFEENRKNVLVQVWGSSGGAARRLVDDLLDDPLLGAVTSEALNEDGERLDEFQDLSYGSTTELAPGG